MKTAINTVPDLLRRFVPTPYHELVRVGDIACQIETNDPEILIAIQKTAVPLQSNSSDTNLYLKLVRDDDAPRDGGEVMVVSAHPLITFLMGTGTVIVLDCHRQEALGFISPSVSAADFIDTLFPLIRKTFLNSISAATQGQ